MKSFSLMTAVSAAIGLTGCVTNPSYDSLGYASPRPTYSVGVSYGTYPVYRPAPVYRPVPAYPPGYFVPHHHHHHHRGHGFPHRHGW